MLCDKNGMPPHRGLAPVVGREGRGEPLSHTYTSSESGGVLYVTLRAECLEDIAETRAE